MKQPTDQPARDIAIDPERSVIVQAPAGSGKTGLLVRRFLTLLGRVEAPEQILAITFTRKATAEMRDRVLAALRGVTVTGEPETDPVLLQLGVAARSQDEDRDWQLANNSRRLRIQTIDSFCSELVRRMPWSARFGAPPVLLEDARALYEEAASLTLDMVEENAGLADCCAVLLDLMDANRQAAGGLVAGMLKNRDQWMRSLEQFDRTQVEGWWRTTIEQRLGELHAQLDPGVLARLLALAKFAAEQLEIRRKTKPDAKLSAVEVWRDESTELDINWQQLSLWRGLAAMLLTNEATVRKTANVTQGFPPGAPQKDELLEMLGDIDEEGSLHRAWQRVMQLPDGELPDDHWRNINALLSLLPVAAAHLRVLFSERNVADYTELAQRADMALGRVDEPSDLALAMDYQLQHLLVDEFQDTSIGQIQLLEKLLAGWTHGDGRTAFFVGDPMQSIYRFREAEVGIFMDTQDRGIADLQPESVSLSANFRSDPRLVGWFNERFVKVMPRQRDILNGAVDYTPAEAFLDPTPGCVAMIHAGIDRTQEQEACRIADIVSATLDQNPADSIALLGRTRGYLVPIIAELDRRGIAWQGVKLQKLAQRQVIQDLLALTLALNDPADRVSWLGVLRGPWLGATLEELSALFEQAPDTTVLERLGDESVLDLIQPARQQQFRHVRDILADGVVKRGERSLVVNLEACWLQLGGPAAVSASDLENARRFFELVEKTLEETDQLDRQLFEEAIAELYADGGKAAAVQIMTIHASKGIEFDTVILPGLHQPGRGEDSTLMRWRVLPDRILVASRTASDDTNDRFYRYLGELDKEHKRNETSRLVYVACTRARNRLHLFGSAGVDDKKGELKLPAKTSLLSVLWPAVKMEFEDARNDPEPDPGSTPGATPYSPQHTLARFPVDWRTPDPGFVLIRHARDGPSLALEQIDYDWVQTLTRVTGIVVHQAFEELSGIGWDSWCTAAISDHDRAIWRSRLARHGVCGEELNQAAGSVEEILLSTRRDPNAQWIFSASHQDVQTEWALTGVVNGQVRHVVLDRVFTDRDGVRWIIDFKSGGHESAGDLGYFLDNERQRYAATMAVYAEIVSNLEQRPVRTALYYPAIQELVGIGD